MNTLELLKLTPKRKIYGIWLGEKYNSDCKSWWDNDQIYSYSQWKNNKRDGIYKCWNHEGELKGWELYKDDEIVKDYLE